MTSSRGKIFPVILCGGSGTRLWPRSRADKPKQFLPLVAKATLFEEALSRVADPAYFHPPLVVTGAQYLNHLQAQLPAATEANVIVEPEPKKTAAAILLAALRLPDDAVMLVCPSDHYIGQPEEFVAAADQATELAAQGWLVSVAAEARRAETGYGYLQLGEEIAPASFTVQKFVEKPSLTTAKAYVISGEYAWNTGIFAFQVRQFIAEVEAFRPHLLAQAREAIRSGRAQTSFFYPDGEAYSSIAGESVDCAVMENTGRAAMVLTDMDWSDIGSWQALHQARERDDDGNAIRGPAEIVDCRNVLVESDGPKVHMIGLKDVIVVIDGNDVMITSADGAQKVGTLRAATTQ